jgi:hypothetical protein
VDFCFCFIWPKEQNFGPDGKSTQRRRHEKCQVPDFAQWWLFCLLLSIIFCKPGTFHAAKFLPGPQWSPSGLSVISQKVT